MKKNEVEKIIRDMIVAGARVPINIEEITEESNLIRDLQYDSLGIISLISELEQKFNISFNYKDIDFDSIMILEGLLSMVAKYISIEKE